MLLLEPLLESKTHIIWDWNGTLLNDAEICVEIISEFLERHGLPSLDHQRYREVFCLPVSQYYHRLGFPHRGQALFDLMDDFMRRYHEEVARCHLFEGTTELLSRLKEQKKNLAILSAANQSDLDLLLDRYQIAHFFDHVYGLNDNYAVSKVERGRSLLQQWQAPDEKIILIGDTDHDHEVAEALGIDVLLLGDGHQHPNRLEKLNIPLLFSRYEATEK